jgi:hypothetical protein
MLSFVVLVPILILLLRFAPRIYIGASTASRNGTAS